MPRPTDTPNWATDHTIEPAGTPTGDTADAVIDPGATKRGDGWDYSEAPPFQFVNWLFRLLCDWVGWLDDFDQNHTHDGGATDYSAPKVDLQNHIDYGSNGELRIGEDGAGGHEIIHDHLGAGPAHFITDIIHCIQIETTDAGVLEIKDDGGSRNRIDAVNAPVAIGRIASTGAIVQEFGIDTVNKTATPIYEITFDDGEPANDIIAAVTPENSGVMVKVDDVGAGTLEVTLYDDTGSVTSSPFQIMVWFI